MKRINILFISLLFLNVTLFAQDAPKSESIAKGLGLFVFPSGGQDQATQDADEFECYKWAMDQTGINPLNPPEVEAQQVQSGPTGAAVGGAARGAAAGAAVGAIAGDTGKGAAIGATLGAIRGRRAGQYGKAVQQAEYDAQAEAQEQEMMDNFKKAFSACMTGKGYTVQ